MFFCPVNLKTKRGQLLTNLPIGYSVSFCPSIKTVLSAVCLVQRCNQLSLSCSMRYKNATACKELAMLVSSIFNDPESQYFRRLDISRDAYNV